MAGIFGPGADAVRQAVQQQQMEQDQSWAQVPAGRGPVAGMAMAGRQLGNAIQSAAGYEDPQVAKARLLEEAKMEVDQSGADLMADPKSYYTAAFKALQSRGLTDEAMSIRQILIDEESAAADTNYKNAQAANTSMKGLKGRYTQNSKGKIIDSWTGAVVEQGSEEYEAASSSAKAYQDFINGAYGDPATPEAQARYEEAINKINYRRPPTEVNVSVKGEEAFLKGLGTGAAERLNTAEAGVQSAQDMVDNADMIDQVLDGDVIVGPGADIRLGIAKVMNIAGADNDDTIAQTQVLMSRLAKTTLAAIPSSNLGGGQGFTERDKEFLKDASAGTINWTPESLRYLSYLNKKAAYNQIYKRNQILERQTPEMRAKIAQSGVDVNPVPLPEVGKPPVWNKKASKAETKTISKPPDVEQELWDVMTPEEKAAWQVN